MRAVLVMCSLDSVRCPNNELGDDLSGRGHSNTHVGVSFLAPLLVSHPNRRTALYLYDCHGGWLLGGDCEKPLSSGVRKD